MTIQPAEILDHVVLNPDQHLIVRVHPRTTHEAAQQLIHIIKTRGIRNATVVAAEEIRVIEQNQTIEIERP